MIVVIVVIVAIVAIVMIVVIVVIIVIVVNTLDAEIKSLSLTHWVSDKVTYWAVLDS